MMGHREICDIVGELRDVLPEDLGGAAKALVVRMLAEPVREICHVLRWACQVEEPVAPLRAPGRPGSSSRVTRDVPS
jgi:hypothetical protein